MCFRIACESQPVDSHYITSREDERQSAWTTVHARNTPLVSRIGNHPATRAEQKRNSPVIAARAIRE
jgi:hypothetical protein